MLDDNQLQDLQYLEKYIIKIGNTEDLNERESLINDVHYIFERLINSL